MQTEMRFCQKNCFQWSNNIIRAGICIVRIFDLCYFLAGLPAEEAEDAFTKDEWLKIVKAVAAGYESISKLSAKEKSAVPCVMECIEICR